MKTCSQREPNPTRPEKLDKEKTQARAEKKKASAATILHLQRIYQREEIVVPASFPTADSRNRRLQLRTRADGVVGRVLAELDEAACGTLWSCSSRTTASRALCKTNVWPLTPTPWLVRWRGVVKPGVHETEHLVAGVDFAPTILDALGLPPMKGMDGRSFLPVLKGQKQKGRDYVYTHINTIASGRSYAMRSLQGNRYGFIWNGWSNGETTFRNESMSGLPGRPWRRPRNPIPSSLPGQALPLSLLRVL